MLAIASLPRYLVGLLVSALFCSVLFCSDLIRDVVLCSTLCFAAWACSLSLSFTLSLTYTHSLSLKRGSFHLPTCSPVCPFESLNQYVLKAAKVKKVNLHRFELRYNEGHEQDGCVSPLYWDCTPALKYIKVPRK